MVEQVLVMRHRTVSIVFVIMCLFLIPTMSSSNGNRSILKEDMEYNLSSELTRDVNFTFTSTSNFTNYVSPLDIEDRSAADVADAVDSFLPEGLERVTDVDIWQADVSVNISQIHVIEDRDIGAGEVYLDIWLNRYNQYVFDNSGSYYVCNDGDYIDVDLLISSTEYSMDARFSIDFYGYESDVDFDDFMGGELVYLNLSSVDSWTTAGWMPFDNWAPDGGSNAIQIELYLNITFSNIQKLSYPGDFGFPYDDGSYLISAAYLPKFYYDTLDGGDNPGISHIYQQVYTGFDSEIGKNVYCIYYMIYYDYEMDNFGLSFGQYYDFEPLLLFVEDIGEEPYRIVYRDVGTHTLPPKVIIHDQYASTGSSTLNVSVTTQLTPILGNHCMVEYDIRDTYWSTPEFQFETDHGLTPFLDVPIFSITNSYHQMELGIVFNNVEVDLSPVYDYLVPFNDTIIRWGYTLLDEAFNSPMNTYEGVSLWNGGDYRVPENSSLTFDMLFNFFEFPYVVDCYEEVAHYTDTAQDIEENKFYYDINLGVEYIVPGTVTMNVPTSVRRGETYEISIDVELDSDRILIAFDYDIEIAYQLYWWFIALEENATYSGRFQFQVNLTQVVDFLDTIGFADMVTGDYVNDWISISSFSTSANLLDTMIEADIEIHLLQIVEDLLADTQVGPLLKLAGFFLDEVDLHIMPSISGSLTTDIEIDNSAIELSTTHLTFDEGTIHQTVDMTVVGGPDTTAISLTNMTYNVIFAVDWGLEVNFTGIVNHFVDDFYFDLGRWPEITVSSDEHTIEASTSTGYDQHVPMTVVNDIYPPVISTSHSPTVPYETENVQVTAQITDDSSMDDVVLSYSINGGSSWTNVTMVPDSTDWIGTIPSMAVGISVMYKVFASDVFSNSVVSSTQSYTVVAAPTTTTSTTTTTTGTTDTSTSTTTSSQTSTSQGDNGTPMVLALSAAAGIVVVLVLVIVLKKKG